MSSGKEYFERFLQYGWKPNFDIHPAEAPLEMVLIEPRDHRYLKEVLENMSCLVPNAALTIFHSEENAKAIEAIVYADGVNDVKTFPVLPSNLTRDEYSVLMTSQHLWKNFTAPKVLLFQLDSGLRYNNLLRFMQYDYIGAPWNWLIAGDPRISVGNGGFSLRNTNMMYDICNQYSFNIQNDIAEDVFFAKYLIDYDKSVLPSKEIARMFSVEHVPFGDPMAFHQAYDFHPLDLVESWMTTDLPPPENDVYVDVLDAWIESVNGRIISHPDLVPWLRLGVSTNGLFIDKDTKITCIDEDIAPGLRKSLKISIQRNGTPELVTIPLNRMCVTQPLLI